MCVSLVAITQRFQWRHYRVIVRSTTRCVKSYGITILLMMTSSNGSIFRGTGPLCGEFTGPGEFPTQRPVTRSFDVFFDLRLNKRLSKQPWGWWFETPSLSLWRHCNVCRICFVCHQITCIQIGENWITEINIVHRIFKCGSAPMTVPWSAGSVAPKTATKHPEFHYCRNLALGILRQSFADGNSDDMAMYSGSRPV